MGRPEIVTRLGLHSEVRRLPLEQRAERLLRAVLEEGGQLFTKSDRCPMCHSHRGFQADDAVCAWHLSEQFVKARHPKGESHV